MSILGFPVLRYIDVDDSEAVLRAIHLTDPEVPLDIVLHTPGGLVLARSRSPAPSTSTRER
jgi:ClpP class serine protease